MRLLDLADDFELLRRRISHASSSHPRSGFFSQRAQFERLPGHDLLQRLGFLAQHLHLVGGCGAGRIAGQTALAGFQELLGPTVIQALRDPLPATPSSDAVLSAVRPGRCGSCPRRVVLRVAPRMLRTACWLNASAPGRRISGSSSLLDGYDEPEILLCPTALICLIGPDAGHTTVRMNTWMLTQTHLPSWNRFPADWMASASPLIPVTSLLILVDNAEQPLAIEAP